MQSFEVAVTKMPPTDPLKLFTGSVTRVTVPREPPPEMPQFVIGAYEVVVSAFWQQYQQARDNDTVVCAIEVGVALLHCSLVDVTETNGSLEFINWIPWSSVEHALYWFTTTLHRGLRKAQFALVGSWLHLLFIYQWQLNAANVGNLATLLFVLHRPGRTDPGYQAECVNALRVFLDTTKSSITGDVAVFVARLKARPEDFGLTPIMLDELRLG